MIPWEMTPGDDLAPPEWSLRFGDAWVAVGADGQDEDEYEAVVATRGQADSAWLGCFESLAAAQAAAVDALKARLTGHQLMEFSNLEGEP